MARLQAVHGLYHCLLQSWLDYRLPTACIIVCCNHGYAIGSPRVVSLFSAIMARLQAVHGLYHCLLQLWLDYRLSTICIIVCCNHGLATGCPRFISLFTVIMARLGCPRFVSFHYFAAITIGLRAVCGFVLFVVHCHQKNRCGSVV